MVLSSLNCSLNCSLRRRITTPTDPAVGDGHRVIIAPGLMATDTSTLTLRRFLDSINYEVEGWGQGRNLGRIEQFDRFAEHVAAMSREADGPVSLIGWSLGGIAARWATHLHPNSVRQVITLGSPFLADPRERPIWPLYATVSRQVRSDLKADQLAAVAATPAVPATSIVSPDDRVVKLEDGYQSPSATSETIEVRGGHFTLADNKDVWRIVADRLAQPSNRWKPYGE